MGVDGIEYGYGKSVRTYQWGGDGGREDVMRSERLVVMVMLVKGF